VPPDDGVTVTVESRSVQYSAIIGRKPCCWSGTPPERPLGVYPASAVPKVIAPLLFT
jgi:hypothetical protein